MSHFPQTVLISLNDLVLTHIICRSAGDLALEDLQAPFVCFGTLASKISLRYGCVHLLQIVRLAFLGFVLRWDAFQVKLDHRTSLHCNSKLAVIGIQGQSMFVPVIQDISFDRSRTIWYQTAWTSECAAEIGEFSLHPIEQGDLGGALYIRTAILWLNRLIWFDLNTTVTMDFLTQSWRLEKK
jgi:hypothetical protein